MRSEFAKWEIKTSVFSGRKSQAGNCWQPRRCRDRDPRSRYVPEVYRVPPSIPYELGGGDNGHMYAAYLRGEAYLELGRGHEAASEFQKVLDHRGVVLNFVTGSLVRLQLARAIALSGDSAPARRLYDDFLALWKDADNDLPVLKAAQSEYRRLK